MAEREMCRKPTFKSRDALLSLLPSRSRLGARFRWLLFGLLSYDENLCISHSRAVTEPRVSSLSLSLRSRSAYGPSAFLSSSYSYSSQDLSPISNYILQPCM